MSIEKELNEWLSKSAADSGEKIKASAMFVGIYTEDYLKSPQCALQLGFAILLDKPIFMIADKKQKLPDALVKIAKHIERVDMSNSDDLHRAQVALQASLKQWVK